MTTSIWNLVQPLLGELKEKKTYHCCIGMVVAKSFTKFAYRQELKSPHPVKLSVVNEKENKLVEDLRDFVALNLHALAKEEGIEVVLRNTVMVS